MARIERAKARRSDQPPSAYTRLFGDEALGNLISRVHGAAISAGTELERLILERVRKVDDLDAFLAPDREQQGPGSYVATKSQIKSSKLINSKYEPDLLVFELKPQRCYVVEVKDGDQFDTKKSAGEHNNLHAFVTTCAPLLAFTLEIRLCCFNATDIDAVIRGLKGKFNREELLTGKDLCHLLGIDYEEICRTRLLDQQTNLEYFVAQLMEIDSVRAFVVKAMDADKR